MVQDAVIKILRGITTVEEAERILGSLEWNGNERIIANKLFSEAYESVLAWFPLSGVKRFHRTAREQLGDREREENDLFAIIPLDCS